MVNTSATGGYILPADPPPLEGQSFDDFMQQVVASVTGLTGDFVRPLWQAEPGNTPEPSVNWAAVGLHDQKQDAYAWVDGDDFRRHEIVSVRCSFYGPEAAAFASRLCDGLQMPQNREVLVANGIGLQETSNLRRAPELVKETWRQRIDIDIIAQRQIRRSYPVLTIATANGLLYTDKDPQIVVPIAVTDT